MIFVNRKDTAAFLQKFIGDTGGKRAQILTSQLTDAERDQIIDAFRQDLFPVLISTNVLARGIDVPAIDIVINYDIPQTSNFGYMEPDCANYLHRVGRTGRFMTDGLCLTFVEDEVEEAMMKKISTHWETEFQEISSFEEFMEIFYKMRPFL